MAEEKRVLIIGENPDLVDFSDPAIPDGTTPDTIRKGLEQSLDELREAHRIAHLVYVDTPETAADKLDEALGKESFDVIVVGAGLRIIPKQTPMFEIVMNIVHARAPQARLAFNMSPDDSAKAAERQLAKST